MGLSELAARVGQSGANGALVISMWKGNPSLLIFTTSAGEEVVTIKMESAKLRREVNLTKKTRIIGAAGVFIKTGSSDKTRELGEVLASFLNIEMLEMVDPEEAQVEENWSLIWLEDLPSGKILWTHYLSTNKTEIGPRIRVTSIRRKE
jgi:rRNA maturation protein Rpf1